MRAPECSTSTPTSAWIVVRANPACRVEAIYWEGDLPDDQHQHLGDNAAFFHQVLPGRVAPLGSPGGAAAVGPIGVDTPLVAAIPVECP